MSAPSDEPGVIKFSIAIDGTAGSGKSSVAKALAKHLGLKYVDTGAMYRGVAWQVLTNRIDLNDEEAINKLLHSVEIQWVDLPSSDLGYRLILNGIDITHHLHTSDVEGLVGVVASQRIIRDKLSHMQRRIGMSEPVVMVGRDIGSAVLPEAQIKIFLTATLEERARRRHADLMTRGINIPYEDIVGQLRSRDELDIQRESSPLKIMPEAVVIDTSGESLPETVNRIVDLVRRQVALNHHQIALSILRLDKTLPLPEYAYQDDAGFDVYSREDVEIRPSQRRKVPTGIAVAIPKGFVGFLCPRSGWAFSHGLGILDAPAVIDSSFRGEVVVILVNTDPRDSIVIKRGERIAQMVIVPIRQAEFLEVDELPSSDRGERGIGSTGLDLIIKPKMS